MAWSDGFLQPPVDQGGKSVRTVKVSVAGAGGGLPSWQPSHVFCQNELIFDGTYLQEAQIKGTSNPTAPPTFNATIGGYTSDGTTVWQNIGLPVDNPTMVVSVRVHQQIVSIGDPKDASQIVRVTENGLQVDMNETNILLFQILEHLKSRGL